MATLAGWLQTWEDRRLGGALRYVIAETDDFLMQVPDEVRKCVVFLMCQKADGMYPVGTAFFVGWPSQVPGKQYTYLVTAKHVIDGIRTHGTDGKVYIRANLRAGGFGTLATPEENWRGPDEREPEYIDIAVLPWVPNKEIDYAIAPLSMFVSDEIRQAIDLGDELFMIGLFVNHYGRERNIPVVRVGNLAGMPEEAVQTDHGPMQAYLAETRSLGGLSGSPTFVMLGGQRLRRGGGMVITAGIQFHLLGVMRGHWDAELEPADTVLDAADHRELVNMGIAIVIPSEKIVKVIDQDDLREQRQRLDAQAIASSLPTADTADSDRPEMTSRRVLRRPRQDQKAATGAFAIRLRKASNIPAASRRWL